MKTKLYFIHALSSLHAGTGQGVGVIDLPIAREKATNIPYVPGSSIKGVLRDRCREAKDGETLFRIFGPDIENAADYASSLQLSDARLLLLPVRSLGGTFAWVTSPYLLQRYARDAEDSGVVSRSPQVPTLQLQEDAVDCLVARGSALMLQAEGRNGVFLEDLDFTARQDELAEQWASHLGTYLWPDQDESHQAWRKMLQQRICIVPDDALTFLLETATEVVARIRLDDETKTVAQGQLWYEESLPPETILNGLALAVQVKAAPTEVFGLLDELTQGILQVGGKATVGRGLCRMQLSREMGG